MAPPTALVIREEAWRGPPTGDTVGGRVRTFTVPLVDRAAARPGPPPGGSGTPASVSALARSRADGRSRLPAPDPLG